MLPIHLDRKGEEKLPTHFSNSPGPSIAFWSQLGFMAWAVAPPPRGFAWGALTRQSQLSWFPKGPRKKSPFVNASVPGVTGQSLPGRGRCSAKARGVGAREETTLPLSLASQAGQILWVPGSHMGFQWVPPNVSGLRQRDKGTLPLLALLGLEN